MSFLRLVVRALAVIARRKHFKQVAAGALVLGLACGALALALLSKAADERKPTLCNVRVDPKPPSAEHTWWFVLVDDDIERLEDARRDLEPLGFSLEQYYYECRNAPCSEIMLRMQKIEAHTSASLQTREAEVCEIAKKHGLNAYWGVYTRE